MISEISRQVYNCSRKFDIDPTSDSKQTSGDVMVLNNILQKTLESDNFTYVEGYKLNSI
jgi:hypothetical protein